MAGPSAMGLSARLNSMSKYLPGQLLSGPNTSQTNKQTNNGWRGGVE
eukprot:COSAG01_NODE_338_length_18671_cov_259.238154_21_plen_47_part_00